MCSLEKIAGRQCGGMLKKRSELSDLEVELVKMRTSAKRIDTLCQKHEIDFIKLYSKKFVACCDPFAALNSKRHMKPVKTNLLEVSYSLAKDSHSCFKLIPGHKICYPCRNLVMNYEEASTSGTSSAPDQETSTTASTVPALPHVGSQTAAGSSQGTDSSQSSVGNEAMRLLLLNLKDLHQAFLEANNDESDKVSLSKFAELRPRECILAGASGTHVVCVCEAHENFKLMVSALRIRQAVSENEMKILTYRDILSMAVCEDANTSCYLQVFGLKCQSCPKVQPIRDLITNTLDERLQDDVTFKQWKSTDGCKLECITMETEEFTDYFIESIPAMLKHSYIAKHQGAFFQHKRDNLKKGEVLVLGDFAENYSFVIQDAIYGLHWNNRQATIHPFVCYHLDQEGKLQVSNFVIISDCMDHDNKTFFAFQQKLVQFLKEKVDGLCHIIYLTDGAPSQYKNRFGVINIRSHKKDFGVTAEHHFFCTAHGKSPCDGCGGCIKRLAARESIQRTADKEQIDSPKKLFNWAVEKFAESISFAYVSDDEVKEVTEKYQSRIDAAPEVVGIRSFHCIQPVSTNTVRFKYYSLSDYEEFRYFGEAGKHTPADVWGFVTLIHDSKWWLAQVEGNDDVTIRAKILQPNGPTVKFTMSPVETITINITDIISVVNPHRKGDTTYSLKRDDSSYAKSALKQRYCPALLKLLVIK